jgi:hypothetical protein
MHLEASALEKSTEFQKPLRRSQKSMSAPATLPNVGARKLDGRRTEREIGCKEYFGCEEFDPFRFPLSSRIGPHYILNLREINQEQSSYVAVQN